MGCGIDMAVRSMDLKLYYVNGIPELELAAGNGRGGQAPQSLIQHAAVEGND
jgi:hypothetical protein